MKKLLFLLVFIPLVSFGQTEDEYFKTGNNYYKNGEYWNAEIQYTLAIELNPNNPKTYLYRAFTYLEREYFSYAIKDFATKS